MGLRCKVILFCFRGGGRDKGNPCFQAVVLKLHSASDSLRELFETQIANPSSQVLLIQWVGSGLRIRIFKFPGEVNAADLGTPLSEPLPSRNQTKDKLEFNQNNKIFLKGEISQV